MNPRQLRAFVAVAQTLNFAQAGERLHLSQPALSLTIKALEDDLGGRLLVRSTRSVGLTPEGETLLPLARRLLADWDSTEELLRQHFTLQLGRVSVAAMPCFAGNLLPHALRQFKNLHPKVNVAVHDVLNEQVIEMVRQRQVELGIGFEPESHRSLVFEPLFLDRFVAVVPLDSPLAQASSVTWAQLLKEDFITLQRPSAVRLLLETDLLERHGRLPVAFETHQLSTVGRMVACGLGVSAVPALCSQQMHESGAQCLPLEEPRIERRIGLMRLADRRLSSAAQALHDVLFAQLSALAAPVSALVCKPLEETPYA
ncbi:LysR family transcriptional regulator [Pseudomonas sp. RIT-PI-S]|uniref:LysR family transcriptional regulator n=1 Tax=Pseudomonas sp. RIT-PI-S TaxID=3035295 RepID=UPI0021D838C4|nr:LysR family transcriptional regulator [Pseudomonas sp. RIT-PI-S]